VSTTRKSAIATSLATGLTASTQTGTFTLTGSMKTARHGHTATLLQNAELLVTGGVRANGIFDPLASAELYNPVAEKGSAVTIWQRHVSSA